MPSKGRNRTYDIWNATPSEIYDYNLSGSSTRVHIPMPKTEFLEQSFCYNEAKLWNQIPDEIRSSVSLAPFYSKLSSSTFEL